MGVQKYKIVASKWWDSRNGRICLPGEFIEIQDTDGIKPSMGWQALNLAAKEAKDKIRAVRKQAAAEWKKSVADFGGGADGERRAAADMLARANNTMDDIPDLLEDAAEENRKALADAKAAAEDTVEVPNQPTAQPSASFKKGPRASDKSPLG
jgi:hypothetical protein